MHGGLGTEGERGISVIDVSDLVVVMVGGEERTYKE